MNFSPFMMPGFDPSKMSPQAMMKVSQLIQTLPPHILMKLQSVMHNMSAGFDVRKDMEAFEKELPAGFREQMMQIFLSEAGGASQGAGSPSFSASAIEVESEPAAKIETVRDARLTVLKAVASGAMTAEVAYSALFEQ